MGMQVGDRRGGPMADINVTPLVDVVLVLLIIFMLTASVIEDHSLKVELPEAATAQQTESSTLGLTIDSDGRWYLNGESTTEEGLRAFIQAELKQVDELQAIIAADRSVPYGEVVKAIDLVKQEGVVQFALNTDPDAVRRDLFPLDEESED